MINNITLVGRWTKDIDLKFSGNGVGFANGHLAVSRPFSKNETDFLPVTMFRKTAELAAQYTKKGSQVAVTGRVQSRKYENNEGRNITVVEVVADNIVFLDKPDRSKNGDENKEVSDSGYDDPFADGSKIEVGDDLPF